MDECLAAVRAALSRSERAGQRVVIACSGGPDSLALAFLVARAREPSPSSAVVAVVDHGLQPDSHAVAATAARQCREIGFRSVAVLQASVTERGDGLEAAARRARQEALLAHARSEQAQQIWLGHTLDDQAETVLMGLTHGSGSRALQAMAEDSPPWVRPLLHLRRAQVREALPASVQPWDDPHNHDRRFLRADVRARLLPMLGDVLGDRAIVNLSRTAQLLREDNAALDAYAEAASGAVVAHLEGRFVCQRRPVTELAQAVRGRLIRKLLLAAGASARDLTSAHITTVTRLFLESDVVGPIRLPGGVQAQRVSDTVVFWSEQRQS